MSDVCLMVVMALFNLSLSMMVIFSCLLKGCFVLGVWTRFGLLRLRVMLMKVWFLMAGFERLTIWVMMLLMRLMTLVAGGLVMLSLMLVVNLSGFCGLWYPIILDLHRFFIAISRAVVNHDGRDGTAPDPPVWSAGALAKRSRLVHAVRAFLPGPPGIWDSEGVNVPASAISAGDVAHWPYTTGLLVKWVSFLGSLQWPAGGSWSWLCFSRGVVHSL